MCESTSTAVMTAYLIGFTGGTIFGVLLVWAVFLKPAPKNKEQDLQLKD